MKTDSISAKETRQILKRNFSFMGKERWRYVVGWLFSLTSLISAYLVPLLYEQITKMVTGEQGENTLWIAVGLFTGFLLLTPFIMLGDYWKKRATAYGTSQVRKTLFSHLLSLPLETQRKYKQGDLITRLTSDSSQVAGAFGSYSITALMKFIVYAIVSLVILLYHSWLLALVSIVLSVVSLLIGIGFNPKLRAYEGAEREMLGSSASFLMEILSNTGMIRIFLMAQTLREKFVTLLAELRDRRMDRYILAGFAEAVASFFTFMSQPLGFLVAIYLVEGNKIPLSKAVFLASVMGVMARGVREFFYFNNFIQSSLVVSKRVYEVLDLPAEPSQATAGDTSQAAAVTLSGMSFGYDDKPILSALDLEISQGEVVAIVGGSGGGKSTLLRLVAALYQPQQGTISVFGTQDTQAIRQLVSYIPQDSAIFDTTIYENIRYGRPSATQQDIEAAAKQANIHEFAMSLPDGYQTLVGENATQISGGQKQRIAIARAILKDAPLLLLDEATSALDAHTEEEINQALQQLFAEKTAIIVSHRLSTIQQADRILVMEQGKIVEQGTHQQLLEANGRYTALIETSQ